MELYNTSTRRKEVIEDQDSLHNALLSGSHSFAAGASVPVIAPDGTIGTVPAENVTAAIQQGYKVETPTQTIAREYVDKNQGIKGALKVGLGQFADEALLGLPELIYDKTADPLEVAKKEALKKEYGLSNALGGLAGFGASMLTGAPLWKGASKAGEAVAKHIAEKIAVETGEQVGKRSIAAAAREIASQVGGRAAEGAIVTLPHAITETALGDPKDAAETMLAGVGIGAVLGTGIGLGKEFLGLGKKVADESARLVGETDLTAQNVARRAAKVITGVNEDDILYYMKNAEKVNKAPTLQALNDEIDLAVRERFDAVTAGREALKNVEGDLRLAYQNARRDLSQVRAPQALADDIVMSLDAEKGVLGQMSDDADKILDGVEGTLKRRTLVRFVNRVKKDIAPIQIGETTVSAASKLDTLTERIRTELPEEIPMVQVREVLRQVRKDINYNQLAGEFNDEANKAKKAFTHSVSELIKKRSPEYAQQMQLMAERSDALANMSKAFGDRERAAATLNRMLKPGGEVKKELLDEFSALTGQNFSEEFSRLVAAKDQLERSAREDISAELVPELFKQRESVRAQLAEAEKAYDPLRKLTPDSTQNAIRNMSYKTPNIATRRAFEALQEATGVPYLEMIKDRNILDAFDKASTQGSRKVNAGALIASTLFSGAAGFGIGGPLGLAAGAAAGATLDIYGGQLLKSLMDRAPNVSGLLFVEKAMKKTADKLDTIPSVIESVAQGIKLPQKSTIAVDAVWRLLDAEAQPTPKERKDASKQLEKVKEKIGTILVNMPTFEQSVGKLTAPLREGGAPQISEHLSLGARNALEYLYNKIPKPPAPTSPFAPKITWEPSDWEMNKFSQVAQVAENPLSVVDEFAKGTLTTNHMDALRAMYPSVANAIQRQVYAYASSGNAAPMNYQDRLRMSLLAGVPLDASLNQIGSMQKRFSEEAKATEESFTPKRKINVAGQQSTELQSALAK